MLLLAYQYENDSEMSSASFTSGPPSDHEDIIGSQSFQSTDDKALYEESRRLVEELDARIADLSSGSITIAENEKKPGKYSLFFLNIFYTTHEVVDLLVALLR